MRTLDLGVLAHVDAGKTSLTERLLHSVGVLDEVGSVDAGPPLSRPRRAGWGHRAGHARSRRPPPRPRRRPGPAGRGPRRGDEGLVAAYLEDGDIGRPRLWRALCEQVAAARVLPVLFGFTITGAGVADLVGVRTTLLPRASADASAPLSGTVFKVERGAGGEKVAWARIMTGTLRVRDRVASGPVRPATRSRRSGSLTQTWRSPGHRWRPAASPRFGVCTGSGSATGWGALSTRRTAGGSGSRSPGWQSRTPDRAALGRPATGAVALRRGPEGGHRGHPGSRSRRRRPLLRDDPHLRGAGRRHRRGARGHRDRHRPLPRHPGARGRTGAGRAGLLLRLGVEPGSMPAALPSAVEEGVRELLDQGVHGWPVPGCAVTVTRSGYWHARPTPTAPSTRGCRAPPRTSGPWPHSCS